MRGDGPFSDEDIVHISACSPHARGWTGERTRAQERPRVFPACAGMDRPLFDGDIYGMCVPRMRGDGPMTR